MQDDASGKRGADLEFLTERHDGILEECRQSLSLFEDPDFPATDGSINFSNNRGKPTGYRWLRPKEINPNARLIIDGVLRSDVQQGGLRDCWILAALAGIAERKDIMARILPSGQSIEGGDYCGAFRFRLRKFGAETEVLVDDRLPIHNGNMVYAQPAGKSEFWVCLLEKAYAKMHGCYEALELGLSNEALADLAGGLCETLQTDNWRSKLHAMARYIDKCVIKKSIVTASTISKPSGVSDDKMANGLVYSHAYTVTGVKLKAKHAKTGALVDLIRLRNPWARAEFNGDWSDDYSGWSDQLKQAVQLVNKDEGEFWMSFDDYAKSFHRTTFMHFTGVSDSAEHLPAGSQWRSHDFYGEWRRGQTSGGAPHRATHFNNPQYIVDLTDSELDDDNMATCLVSLEEPDQRHLPEQERKYISKSIYLYRLPDKEVVDGQRPVAESYFATPRTITHRFHEKPGRYAVMACCQDPNDEAQFFLRIFTEI